MDVDDARRLGAALLAEHGLDDWTLRIDRAKRRAGVCRYADRVIGLSGPLTRLHSEAEVRDTLLHEIAHALVGPAGGHGPRWRATARRIGCSAQRCLPPDAPRVAGAWVGTCPVGHTTERHRRPTRVTSCSRCSPTFSTENLHTWTHHGEQVAMHPQYEAELAELRSSGGPAPARPHRRVRVGDEVRVLTPGRWHGAVGPVVTVGRTRFHVAVGRSVLTVPMTAVALTGSDDDRATG